MKELYKFERVLMITSFLLVSYILVGCAEKPKVRVLDEKTNTFKTVELEDHDNIKYICSSNGFWYKKTGTTSLEIVKDIDTILICDKRF